MSASKTQQKSKRNKKFKRNFHFIEQHLHRHTTIDFVALLFVWACVWWYGFENHHYHVGCHHYRYLHFGSNFNNPRILILDFFFYIFYRPSLGCICFCGSQVQKIMKKKEQLNDCCKWVFQQTSHHIHNFNKIFKMFICCGWLVGCLAGW